MTRRIVPLVAGALALTLTACGSSGDSSSTPSTSPTPETSSSTSDADVIDEPQEEQIYIKRARSSLPGLDVLPEGYTKDASNTIDADSPVQSKNTEPTGCAALLFAGEAHASYDDARRTAGASQHYRLPGDGSATWSVKVSVTTYEEPYPLELFDSAGRALGTCDTFTVQPPEGAAGPTDLKASPISAPALGDRTFAVRTQYPALGQSVDYLYVRSGHNLIRILVRGDSDDYDATLLEDLATATLDNLARQA